MIYVCDAIMGSGKSTAIINYMNGNPERKYIYITPYLDEAGRIRESCPDLGFIEPESNAKGCGKSKASHAAMLIGQGKNIASTHQAFLTYSKSMLANIREQGYTLVIDENIELLKRMDIKRDDYQILIDSGYVEVVDGRLKRTDKAYRGSWASKQLDLIEKVDMYTYSKDRPMYWLLPVNLVTSFRDVFILTYLFEGQGIYHYMRINHLDYQMIGVRNDSGRYTFCDYPGDVPAYTKNLKNKIHICMDERLNEIGQRKDALSATKFKTGKVDMQKLKGNLRSFFRRMHKDIPAKKRMWTVFKGGDSSGVRDSCVKMLADKGYLRSHVQYNARATNKYREKTVLAYLVNVYMNLPDKQFYQSRGLEVDENKYSLSVLVQWIWRSAIRDGEDIYLYIPSRRMRELLINWIDSFDQGGDGDEAE